MFNKINIIRQFKHININLYIHDSFFDIFVYNLNKNRLLLKLNKKLLNNLNIGLKFKQKIVIDNLVVKFYKQIKNLIYLFIKKKILQNF